MDPKHQIMKAAIHLIAQKGFAATSIREIAMMASVNLSMINYYFSSKERLLDSILQDGIRKIMEKRQRILIGKQTEIEKIYALIDINIKYVSRQHEMAKIIFQEELVKSSPAIQEMQRINYQSFKEIINAGKHKGVFSSSINPEFLYSTIVGTIQQYTVKHVSHAMTTDNEARLGQFSKHVAELTDYLKVLCSKLLLK